MNTILRIIIAVVIGAVVTAVLDYYGLLTDHINTLLGVVAALLFYFGYPDDRRLV